MPVLSRQQGVFNRSIGVTQYRVFQELSQVLHGTSAKYQISINNYFVKINNYFP